MTKEAIYYLYERGLNAPSIAKILNLTPSYVYRVLQKKGIRGRRGNRKILTREEIEKYRDEIKKKFNIAPWEKEKKTYRMIIVSESPPSKIPRDYLWKIEKKDGKFFVEVEVPVSVSPLQVAREMGLKRWSVLGED